ncbi:MAG: hypothetical protein MZW92_65960 [Comamonadaceae bacterium]|nr:hypothetical protein [Comamonadaceae bacterium]
MKHFLHRPPPSSAKGVSSQWRQGSVLRVAQHKLGAHLEKLEALPDPEPDYSPQPPKHDVADPTDPARFSDREARRAAKEAAQHKPRGTLTVPAAKLPKFNDEHLI